LRDWQGTEDTICAIATPLGESGVGIIRVSGREALSIVAPLYKGKRCWNTFESHTVHYGEVVNPEDQCLVDQALFIVMFGPRSYTAEDVVEIQAHGNPYLLQKILSLLLIQGARLAEPGEFTRRAFLSGQIDLAQAEAVMEVISARSAVHLQWALGQLKGRLSEKIFSLKNCLLPIIAQIEASIDFSEEGLSLFSVEEMSRKIDDILDEVKVLLLDFEGGKQVREGFSVVIVGRPNVGKSSLFNLFLQEDRAIVTAIPGTTRDILQEVILLNGTSIRLVDTAGYRETEDDIEKEGVRRAVLAQKSADLTIWVLDGSKPFSNEDLLLEKSLGNSPRVILLNKSDLPFEMSTDIISSRYPSRNIMTLSTKTGAGFEVLKENICNFLKKCPEKEQPLVALTRHHRALQLTEKGLERAKASMAQGLSWEFPAIDLREAIDALGEITGETVLDEVLDQVFSQFCIGK